MGYERRIPQSKLPSTGVRGIGKTTTARLLARALNYESDTVKGPSVELATPGNHCELIMASGHMDVLEMDAASRTGVENMREMLDGVRYAPATARYKVYIIDEVHMLSAGDSLSLLDQAIVQAGLDGAAVSGEQVRTMLGLADRIRILDLFALAATGDGKGALVEMRSQYDDGADPAIVMRDMLDICHEVSRAKTLGTDAAFDAAPDQIARLQDLAEKLSLGQLTRIWQMLLKAHGEVRMAPAPLAAAEMALLKLSVAGQMPPPELAAQHQIRR